MRAGQACNAFVQRPWMRDTGSARSNDRRGKGLQGIVAGAFTGALEISITYPTEFIKVNLQLDQAKGKDREYRGITDVYKKTVKKYGHLGLYRGLSVMLYGAVPKAAVRFGTFETLKENAVDVKGNLSPLKRMLCGLGAGVMEAIAVVTPMETIKTKFINDQRSANPKFKGFFQGTMQIIKQEGFRGIYKGLLPTIMRQGSNQAIRFFVVESLKNYYKNREGSHKVPKYMTALFGSTAGGISVCCNAPIDVIKTRMQGLEAKKYKNSFHCAKMLWVEGGYKAFYKGTTPRLMRRTLAIEASS
ncbi:hypothetical protein GE061_007491 [Apolygus lucorum]|uniref:Citrate transport protein n=1 Tax=Apolygus lucorum TaxID=248454 RepID=A0A8S9WVW8_APOLU|nr:hypothetical protein GE061_007491 [Apolygus lucorum]